MNEPNETIECWCGGTMRRAARLERVEYAGLASPEFTVPFYRCERCEAEMETGKDMRVTERQVNLLKARTRAEAP